MERKQKDGRARSLPPPTPDPRHPGHGHPHVEMAAADHPGEQLQGMGGVGVRRRARQFAKAALYPVAQRLTLTDRVDLLAVERATDDEAHAPIVVRTRPLMPRAASASAPAAK